MLIIKFILVTFNLFTNRQIKFSGGWLVLLREMQLLYYIRTLNRVLILNKIKNLGLISCNIEQKI